MGIGKKIVAVEAKFVKDLDKSMSNPEHRISHMEFAVKHREFIVNQAQKYSSYFNDVVYHTNSPEFARHYNDVFKENGIKNIKFVITPISVNK